MKKVYWRPRAVSRVALSAIAALSIGSLLLVENTRAPVERPFYAEKLAAAQLAEKCMDVLKQERIERGYDVELDFDPWDTGMIGQAMTSATSDRGLLSAKQISTNPNFAAVLVEMLKTIGVEPGDSVAVGYSGSFPALNVSVCAALETLKLKPISVSSAASSQWGANLPNFLWIDMEQKLHDEKLISFRSVAASIGGVEDRGLSMLEDTRRTLKEGVERVSLPLIDAPTFTKSVDERMQIYRKQAAGARIRVYINVGGGTTSVGSSLGKKLLKSGLNTTMPAKMRAIDSVMTRFLTKSVPVIHLVRIEDLAKDYGLPTETGRTPQVGEGQVFFREEYNSALAATVLCVILLSLYAFIRSDWGFRIFQSAARRKEKESEHPEPMI